MLTSVSFPGLHLHFELNRVAFTIFGKDIYWYGLIIAAGFLLAACYGCVRARQFGLTQDNILDMLLVTVPIAIICARAYYCIFYWELFRDNPISVLYIWEGGLAIYGGVIGAVLTVWIFAKVRKLRPTAIFDIGALGLFIGQSIGRWGNFVNGEAFGAETDSFLRMGLSDGGPITAFYHPTFLYESVWNLVGFAVLHFYSKRRKFDGEVFLLYVAWYGLGRAWIEGLRTDSLYLFGTGLRVSQVLAAVSCLAALGFWIYHRFIRKHTPDELYVNVRKLEETEKTQEKENEHDAD